LEEFKSVLLKLGRKIDESALASGNAFPGRGDAIGRAFSGTLQTSSWTGCCASPFRSCASLSLRRHLPQRKIGKSKGT
jgi:hypothetical protein